MHKVQQGRLDALHRIRSFMDANADAVGTVNQSSSRAALDDVLTRLEARASAQYGATVQATGGTQQKNELREDLRRHHMQPIAAIASATLAHTPFIAKLRLPNRKVNDSTLVAAGNAMADVAAQYANVFIEEQLPADFIEQLRASVEAVRQAAVARDAFQRNVTEATQAVDDELVRAKSVVKVLDSLVTRQIRDRTDLLAGWRRAKHAKAKGGVPQGTTTAAPVTPTEPAVPVTPAVSATPATEVTPVVPIPAVAPVSAASPAAPVTTVAPATPAVSASPVTEAVLVTPDAPASSETPVIPITATEAPLAKAA